MKKLLKFLLVCIFMIVINGCNEDSYIENIGFVENTNNQSPGNGSVVFWTTNANPIFFCTSGLNIYVDGAYVGSLTETRSVSPNCGSSSGGTVSISLSEGIHSVTANGTGTLCTYSYNFNVEIIKNNCLSQQLN
jgi:hypothetical protein